MRDATTTDAERHTQTMAGFLSAPVIACLVATLARIVLVRDIGIHAIADASLDDHLFVFLGRNIANGIWLGDYSNATLARGPGYPIFIGLASYLHIPLLLAQEALYLGACASLALALWGVTRNRGWSAALYIVLLFNPMMWEAGDMLRVIRQPASIPLMMILVASVAGCLFTETRIVRRAWATVGGFSLAMTWLTREESAWIAPTIGVLVLAPLLLRGRIASPRSFYAHCAVMLAIAAALVGLVSTLNRVSYGVFTIVEFRDRAFNDALGALSRVNPSERLPAVTITRKSRELTYAVSPAFRELRPFLEGRVGRAATEASHHGMSVPGAENEIFAGWMVWALRSAAEHAGHYDTPRNASAYYRRLADEINTACARGSLPCSAPRSGSIPPLDIASLRRAADELRGLAGCLIVLPGTYDRMEKSSGSASNLKMFAAVTRSRLSPTDREIVTRQSRIRGAIAWIYRAAALLLSVASPLLVWLAVRHQRRAGRIEPLSLVAVAALSGVLACTALLALMGATSMPATNPGYVAMPYPFFLLVLWALAHEGLAGRGDTLATRPSSPNEG